MNFLYVNPKHVLQAERNLTGLRLTCHFVTCHIMWFAGRLQQREDLQPSSNESTQSDLYERLVYIHNSIDIALAIGHWAFGHTKRCHDFFDWPPNNKTMQWFAWVTTKQQIPGAQLPMLIATFIEEADYYPFYMSCHCGPPLWIHSVPYWDHVLHYRGCQPMC